MFTAAVWGTGLGTETGTGMGMGLDLGAGVGVGPGRGAGKGAGVERGLFEGLGAVEILRDARRCSRAASICWNGTRVWII